MSPPRRRNGIKRTGVSSGSDRVEESRNGRLDHELIAHSSHAGVPEPAPKLDVGRKSLQCCRNRDGISLRNEYSGAPLQKLANPAGFGSDNRYPGRHRLDQEHWNSFSISDGLDAGEKRHVPTVLTQFSQKLLVVTRAGKLQPIAHVE
jgi:hypothetical protein